MRGFVRRVMVLLVVWGSSYCMRSHLVPQVIGASCAACASQPVVVPPGSPSQR
jgi:hypothetical protein